MRLIERDMIDIPLFNYLLSSNVSFYKISISDQRKYNTDVKIICDERYRYQKIRQKASFFVNFLQNLIFNSSEGEGNDFRNENNINNGILIEILI